MQYGQPISKLFWRHGAKADAVLSTYIKVAFSSKVDVVLWVLCRTVEKILLVINLTSKTGS